MLRIRDRERKLISKIDEALGRIDDGSYGKCEECASDIGIARLKARRSRRSASTASRSRKRRNGDSAPRETAEGGHPAAGLGTRFLPATKAIPKEMLPIVDVPTIQYVVQEAVDSGLTEIVLVTGRGKSAIEDHFDLAPELEHFLEEKGKRDLLEQVRDIARMVQVVSVRQQEPRGLGHAVLAARHAVGNEPFAVLLGDDIIDGPVPCIRQLLDVYAAHGAVIALRAVAPDQTPLYGVIAGQRVASACTASSRWSRSRQPARRRRTSRSCPAATSCRRRSSRSSRARRQARAARSS